MTIKKSDSFAMDIAKFKINLEFFKQNSTAILETKYNEQ